MTTLTAHEPGTFCWVELGTTDRDAAEQFYTQLFGWSANRSPVGPGPDDIYLMFQHQGRDVAAGYKLAPEQQKQGVPPHWLSYVSVADADATAAKAESLGAAVLLQPFDVMEHGRMAVLQDPQGASFAIWQAKHHAGVAVRDEVGSLCWNEVATTDHDGAVRFYTGLFGYETQPLPMPTGPYTIFVQGEKQRGGCLQITPEWGDVPPHWMPYFSVADVDAFANRCAELGGKVCVPPFDVPNVGRMTVLNDPQGAAFSIITLNAGQA